MKITVLYFGQLKEEVGTARESLEIDASTVARLYDQLKERHDLTMPFDNLSPEAERIASHGQQSASIENIGCFDPDRPARTTGSR